MSESKRDRHVYKVLPPEQWRTFQTDGVFTGSPVDVQDGFIHLSCAPQLKATLDKWYAQYTEVVLLEVEAAEIEADLKYDVSRGGAAFPHLFADLPLTAVSRVWLVSPAAGVYSLPEDLKTD